MTGRTSVFGVQPLPEAALANVAISYANHGVDLHMFPVNGPGASGVDMD